VTPAQPTREQENDAAVALVNRARNGDSEAFDALVRTYQRQVISVAFRLLGNGEDAQDVGQEAFVRAYRSLPQLADPSRFAPWLMRTVTNLALNFRRARRLRSAASLDESEGLLDTARTATDGRPVVGNRQANAGPLPDEVHGAVTRAIETLPDKQRLALVLFSVEGMPQKDVAEILDCSAELVKWNVFQARKKLKELLAEYLE